MKLSSKQLEVVCFIIVHILGTAVEDIVYEDEVNNLSEPRGSNINQSKNSNEMEYNSTIIECI